MVELVEFHKKGPSKGHVWDRMLVRQGPCKAKKNEVLPLPFTLRVPPGVSNSGKNVHWEVRGYVDIDWAFDIDAQSDINMRNVDIERLRYAGASTTASRADPRRGPALHRQFQPPAQRAQLGIRTSSDRRVPRPNLPMHLDVENTALFK